MLNPNYTKLKKISPLCLCILLVFSSALIVFSAPTADAADIGWTNINLPYTINDSGKYNVAAYTGNNPNDLLYINASNVVINGNGNTIQENNANNISVFSLEPGTSNVTIGNFTFSTPAVTGGNTNFINFDAYNGLEIGNCTFINGGEFGIRLEIGVNSKIYNCTFTGNDYAISYYSNTNELTNALIYNCTFTNSKSADIEINGCHGVIIKDYVGTESCNIYGYNVTVSNVRFIEQGNVYAYDSSDIVIEKCIFDACYTMAFENVTNLTIQNNTFINNTIAIVYVDPNLESMIIRDNYFSGNHHTLGIQNKNVLAYNNYFGDDVTFDNTTFAPGGCTFGPLTKFYVNPTNGTRITGGIGQIGGNFWANSNGTGYSQTAADIGDGFAAPYTLTGVGQVDQYPLILTDLAPPPTPTPPPTETPTPTPTAPPSGGGGGGGGLPPTPSYPSTGSNQNNWWSWPWNWDWGAIGSGLLWVIIAFLFLMLLGMMLMFAFSRPKNGGRKK